MPLFSHRFFTRGSAFSSQIGKATLLNIARSFRPFPKEAILEACADIKELMILEKAFSFGLGGILQEEIRSAFYKHKNQPTISGFVLGLA